LLLVDEIHHFNKTQQDALLPSVERGDVLLIGMTTENPGFYVNAALRSRVTAFEFMPVPDEELSKILDNALNDNDRGISSLKVIMTPEARAHLVRQSHGDARRLLNALEIAALTTARTLTEETGNPASPRNRSRKDRFATTRNPTIIMITSPPSSNRYAARTPTRRFIGWRRCSRRGKSPGSSRGGS
jgi:replication-associated recombination protein RarA